MTTISCFSASYGVAGEQRAEKPVLCGAEVQRAEARMIHNAPLTPLAAPLDIPRRLAKASRLFSFLLFAVPFTEVNHA